MRGSDEHGGGDGGLMDIMDRVDTGGGGLLNPWRGSFCEEVVGVTGFGRWPAPVDMAVELLWSSLIGISLGSGKKPEPYSFLRCFAKVDFRFSPLNCAPWLTNTPSGLMRKAAGMALTW